MKTNLIVVFQILNSELIGTFLLIEETEINKAAKDLKF